MGTTNRGTCQGDSGSPVMKELNLASNGTSIKRTVQLGIVSNGSGRFDCGRQGIPDVGTNMVFHMKWILDNIKQ